MQSALERKVKILEILSSRKIMKYAEIMKELEAEFPVSISTLQRDIDYLSMKQFIGVEKGRNGGVYLKKKMEIKYRLVWSEDIMDLLIRISDSLTDPKDLLLIEKVMNPGEYFGNMHEHNSVGNDNIQLPPPVLISIDELQSYLGIGRSKAIKILHEPGCPFALKLGGRVYAHRRKLDSWLDEQAGNAFTDRVMGS